MNITELIKVILIGIVEGITEWLPISSTGHMLLFDEFIPLNLGESFKEMFFVVIQLGAILAVAVIFFKKMLPIRLDRGKIIVEHSVIKMWIKVAAACLPAAFLGFFLDDFLEENFGNALTISAMLILYGVLFIIIENRNKNRFPAIEDISEIDYKTAVLIGLFQALAMIPGTSRSGATILGALLLGVSRTAAAEFSFFLAVPTMLGASALKLLKFGFDFTSSELIALVVGMLTAFAVSVAAIRFLMNFVKNHSFKFFGWYRIVLGVIVLLVICIR
ncbi:MAG: undecaprenyl-diphosphate phosphatase [Clostridia bacterium]|nr:undecaprenyl-diphosphate phosphatase [Clostridia bacterium]